MHDMQHSGFLWAYRVSDKGKTEPVSPDALSTALPEEGYLWVHLQSDIEDSEHLMQQLGLPQSVTDALLALETRPRALSMMEGALIYLRAVNKNPDADPEDMVSLRVWLKGNLLVTARRKDRRLESVAAIREQFDAQQAPACPRTLLIELVGNIADRIHDTVDDMDDMLVECETRDVLNKADRQTLAALRRQAATMRRFLAPQRDALEALQRLPGVLSQEQAFELREQSDRVTRYVEDLDLARERAIVLQDELRNRIADQQGVRMYVLSMVTAIFLPLSFLTGVFGMNVGGLPGTDSQDAFTLLMGAMGVLAVFMLIAMLWKRWL
ncbi:zinc transporter ZntB [Alteromonas antoniana]|uniref:zinc transporter ZntB n=1 Tax=Alteromonas antoniana TaxID=2803813 RepID=UPI001C44C900|nr:zinc transporter ZntB [Alteromonas antoniana]